MAKPIYVKVSFTLVVDPEVWAREYGVALSEVRADVKVYAENGVKDHLMDMGLTVRQP